MMQNFRARSHLLISQYEEEDEVQHSISDTTDSDQDETLEKEKQVTPSKLVHVTYIICIRTVRLRFNFASHFFHSVACAPHLFHLFTTLSHSISFNPHYLRLLLSSSNYAFLNSLHLLSTYSFQSVNYLPYLLTLFPRIFLLSRPALRSSQERIQLVGRGH